MKYILTVTLAFFVSMAQGSIIDAQDYYKAKQYIQSFQEYQKLAKLGNIRAQYNVAKMMFAGLGTETNVTEAYSWAVVAGGERPRHC